VNPRIETAEILSFRLKVPPAELERLPDMLGRELNLAIEDDGGELLVSMDDGDSYLRFRPIGTEAMLTEVFLCNDDRGLFFQRVLGALMVRFGGDLHIRLTWNTPDRNSHGDFAEVRISRGSTTYPGLANSLSALPPAHAGASGGGAEVEDAGEGGAGEEEAPLSAQEKEIQEILGRARTYWDQYQRSKKKA
jgi:hypothetical protein